MYLRCNRRFKDGKEHCYWNIVEAKRCADGRVVQRQVLYLGEINDSQREAWCRVVEAFDEDTQQRTQLALFPAQREVPEHAKAYGVQVRLEAMQLYRPRQWGACWLACQVYEQLELDRFWEACLADSREGTRWRHILQTLVVYRLIDPGSEWRLHRLWFEQSAMGDLLGADYSLVEKNALYRCLDKVLVHKSALFTHLTQRWQDLFGARFDVLLYDLTSTYFESRRPTGPLQPSSPICSGDLLTAQPDPCAFQDAYPLRLRKLGQAAVYHRLPGTMRCRRQARLHGLTFRR